MNVSAVLICAALLLSAAARAEDPTAPSGTAKVQPPQIANAHTMPPGAYPLMSTALGEEGDTTLHFTIKTDGSVADVQVVKSSGSPRLDEAAVEGARSWRYVPAMQNGKPVSVPWTTRVQWRLEDSSDDLRAHRIAMLQASASDFPSDATRPTEEHLTLLSLQVSNEGKVSHVQVVRSSGDPKLDAAAAQLALSRVKSRPAAINGKPVATLVPLVVIWPGSNQPASK